MQHVSIQAEIETANATGGPIQKAERVEVLRAGLKREDRSEDSVSPVQMETARGRAGENVIRKLDESSPAWK